MGGVGGAAQLRPRKPREMGARQHPSVRPLGVRAGRGRPRHRFSESPLQGENALRKHRYSRQTPAFSRDNMPPSYLKTQETLPSPFMLSE